ncbi:uncharacterized protein LOC134080487 [Sardina pilchardus]|uniref:uncharacterized protein LOC134080487 n=1 Tax=Sardina pilchardus TaxID=27697 RepID=UPI002E12C9F0
MDFLDKYCPKKRKKRSPSVCTWTVDGVEEEYVINEKSLTINEGEVQLELVNRKTPEDTHLVSFPLDETFYMKQVRETARETASLAKTGVAQTLEDINKAMGIYGIVAGFIGAGKFFAENDTARGAFTLSQSLHGLGDMTGLNQQISRMSRNIFQKALHRAAGEMGMESVLEKASSSLERFGESTAGNFLKDIPIVGLGFQGYFIAEDIIAIQQSNRSSPNQNKYFGLKVTNLVLDVSTTVLTIAEVAFPPAAIILEPIVIGLTIARMSIGDFYCDIVSELDKLPRGASDFDKMIAVINGLEEGYVDFVTGGLLREMEALDKEEQQNKDLLRNLSTPESYFKITIDDGSTSTLDLMDGILSQYGGFVTVQLLNNGSVKIQVGGVDDGQGGFKTIEKLFYNPSIQSIVLGVGESSQFLYKEKTAHLWWVIPVYHKKVICGEIKLHSSLFGTYYGNDKDNQFTAMQVPAKHTSASSEDPCAHGQIDLEFVIKNYHYTIHGHGGDDSFFMGPQKSVLSGGDGRDLYVFPPSGTNAEIDNFSEDRIEDYMIIKATFDHIDCVRDHTDLLLVYGAQRSRIIIRDWFVHSEADHYQHMTFQSSDGIRFKVEDRVWRKGQFRCMCVAETLDNTKSKVPIAITLEGKYERVVTVIGSAFSDSIVGNQKNNILNGGPGEDKLEGGEGADTYEIFSGEGCDTINNYAKDQKMDLVVFHAPFSRIQAELRSDGLFVFDKNNASSTCVLLGSWDTETAFQHVAFLSADHVTFQILRNQSQLSMMALMVDLSKDTQGSTINLSEPNQHLLYVITVFDSAHDDVITGNSLGNFLSCSGGRDHLQGADGSDKYVIKSGCKEANINNLAKDQSTDVLFLGYPFDKVKATYEWPNLILKVDGPNTKICLRDWLKGEQFQHLLLQTIDGVISKLPSNISESDILTPFEIDLSEEKCTNNKRTFDLSKYPYKKVQRFKAKSSECSYNVIGNSQDNYIDPGIGNAMKYQNLKGGNGSDTYVFGHGYGYVNEIDNEAKDMKTDYLFLGVLYKHITVLLEQNNVVLSSKSRNDSVQVRLLKYQNGPEHQHLVIKSLDGFLFKLNLQSYPYKSVLYIDTSTSTKSCNISCAERGEFSTVSQIYGATDFSNYITGSKSSSIIIGGNNHDYLQGNEGNERIEGLAGNDILIGDSGDDVLFGGTGDDNISGGPGNDMIYGGWGADQIDGGPGVDTIFFSGDVKTSTGVRVDLNLGTGKWADAENDTYTDVEAVSGTNFNDILVGNDDDNELVGKFGNDTLIPWHGSDYLFGGPGNDLYILDDCSGVKHINNFASDKALDHIVIQDFNPEDACFFLQERTLVIAFRRHSPLLSLLQRDSLTILMDNWSNNGSFYQHVDFVFANDTTEKSSFFNSAVDIGPTVLELNSTSHTLFLRPLNETAIEVKVNVLHEEDQTVHKMEVQLKYYLEVSDQLFFSDSLHWEKQPVIMYSGFLSGVIYHFKLYVALCELPVLVLTEAMQRTPPTPPTNLTVTHISHDRIEIEWTAPPTASDPNNSKYIYLVQYGPWDTMPLEFETSLTSAKITDLKSGTGYTLSVSSVIEGVESLSREVNIETPNLCTNFAVPEGTTVINEKMTQFGAVVVIECEKGFQLISSPEILCSEERDLQPCVPKPCTHQGRFITHGTNNMEVCFENVYFSRCQLGVFHPPIPVCCPPLPYILNSHVAIISIYSYREIRAVFTCESGYLLTGPNHLTCDLTTGKWSRPYPQLPSCSSKRCPDPPHVSHGSFTSPLKSRDFEEGDTLVLECDDQYHPSDNEWITCRDGGWELFSSCTPNARLTHSYKEGYKLHGILEQWRLGVWTYRVDFSDARRLSEFCCKERGLELHAIRRLSHIKVECIGIKLETHGRKYMGKAVGNIDGNGWEEICIEEPSAARSYCQMLFQSQEWTVSVRSRPRFYAGYSYRCDHHHECHFQKKGQSCFSYIQCRAMCDPFPIPNGRAECDLLEGHMCSVSCNRLFNLQGSSEIWCTSNGWSSNPYCIESGECGYDHERGPHSVGCLKKLWTSVGCHLEANLSPTKREDYWSMYNHWTVAEVRGKMASLPLNEDFHYNPDCEVEECFPGHATVLTSDGTGKTMAELKLGDRVLAMNAHGQLVFSEVILWLDRRPAAVEHYVLLTTEGSPEPLALSDDHVTFIATSNGTATSATDMIPVFAKDLQRGHLLFRHDPGTGSLVARCVTNVQDSKDLGAYAPMTVEGNLIVDGHLVSCYALQCRQYLAHLPFAPYRLLHTLRSYVPFFSKLFPLKHQAEEEGMHWYANAWHHVGKWFDYPFGETCYPRELQQYLYP